MAFEAALKSDEQSIPGESFGANADPLAHLIQASASILHLSNGVTLAVPASLQAITTYVILEQETWFEKELAFLPHLLKPGMTAIDIGANLGIYSLAMARLVAPGKVFAYEPASEPRALLERSRELNGASNLEISAAALSDSQREGHLAFGASSELNALADAGPGERVPITTLDLEEAKHGWPAPDFVKIDAEGEEERVLAGGAKFFAHHSPLVMFEIKAGNVINENLLSIFPGWDIGSTGCCRKRRCSFPPIPTGHRSISSSICSRRSPIARRPWRRRACSSRTCRSGSPMRRSAPKP